MDLSMTEVKPILVTAAFAMGVTLLLWAALEVLRETQRIETTVTKADVAARQVWDMLREATDITRAAAEDK